MTWGDTTKAQRVRSATIASRAAAAKREQRKRAEPARSEYRPGMHPNTRDAIGRKPEWLVACRSAQGWIVPTEHLRITKRQFEMLAHMALFDRLHWGAMGDIAQAMGMQRKSSWWLSKALMRKFKVHNRFQLHTIALEIARNKARRTYGANQIRGRGGPGNRASMFATVTGESVRTGEHNAISQTEALHPGPHASRVL